MTKDVGWATQLPAMIDSLRDGKGCLVPLRYLEILVRKTEQ